jgi:hypothetical protein
VDERDEGWKQSRPMRARLNEVYNHDDKEWYHVYRVVTEINANPELF